MFFLFDSSLFAGALSGAALGVPLYVLRRTVDQGKGFLFELLVITALIAVACGLTALTDFYPARNFIAAVALPLQFLSLAMVTFTLARLGERLVGGQVLYLADFFRLSTAIACSLLLLRVTGDHEEAIFALVASLVFLQADSAEASRHPYRGRALAFAGGVCALTVLVLIFQFRSGFAHPMPAGVAISVYTAGLVLSAVALPILYRNSTTCHRLAIALAGWQLRTRSPDALIRLRPPLDLWHFRPNVCFLNHGSFGAAALPVRKRQQQLQRACNQEPIDFLTRSLETLWTNSRRRLATWLGTQEENLALCENATAAMNEIAHWFPLGRGDEVVLNDHEYGAVQRIWRRRCAASDARLVMATLRLPTQSPEQVIDDILAVCSERTKLVIVSHITSPTAIRLPVEALCRALKERGIASCIDGPHALLQERVHLTRLGCDFYTASCHKWLCAPLGSGCLYVAPAWQNQVAPQRLSWGRLQPAAPESWSEELLWTGSHDFSPKLALPSALELFEELDRDALDGRNHALARYARRRLLEIPGCSALTPEDRSWFGWMIAVQLPAGDHDGLQHRLWERYRVEVPVFRFHDRHLVRVSCHLYNSTEDIDLLAKALHRECSR